MTTHQKTLKVLFIAGTHSGCGKTSTSLGLMAALVRRGYRVQPFKAGPDFIDPGHHAFVTGRPSLNLDGWMHSKDYVRQAFARASYDADIAIIEGAMGLFDGASGTDETGSAAQLAKWLNVPVLLVADARSMARSAAAMVKGYTDFDPALRFAGVAMNNTGSDNHRELLSEAIHALPNVRLAGMLHRNPDLAIPSRHLGLVTADELVWNAETISRLAKWVEQGINVDALLKNMPDACFPFSGEEFPTAPRARVAVARDHAFCFYYQENLHLLKRAGAELVAFSPTNDACLPDNIQGIYLGGGYPELYAKQLAANASMRENIKQYAQRGGAIYAECGGFMYLMRTLENKEGVFPMAGVFDVHCHMKTRFQALGYREIQTTARTLLGPENTLARGHEFHYSHSSGHDAKARPVYQVRDRKGAANAAFGLQKNNVLGSYVHVHFGSQPEIASAFVNLAQAQKI